MKAALMFAALAVLVSVSAGAEERKGSKYLGNNGSKYDTDSVNNPYGKYGSKYSQDSINNPYGQYGSRFSNDSARNPYATNAPQATTQYGRDLGRVSTNPYAAPATQHPDAWRNTAEPSELYSDED